jgi:hypothetical protein
MVKGKKVQRPELDLDTEALAALEEARGMPHGPARTEAMKKAGILRNAADLHGIVFLRSAHCQQHATEPRPQDWSGSRVYRKAARFVHGPALGSRGFLGMTEPC